MTHPLILEQTRMVQGIQNAASAEIPNPRAVAVALLLRGKLIGNADVADLPLEELVAPEALGVWKAALSDPETQGANRREMERYVVTINRVWRRADGTTAVQLHWELPDGLDDDGFELRTAPRMVLTHWFILTLVAPPDDWRVVRVE